MNQIQIVTKKQNKLLDLVVCLPGSNFSATFLTNWSEFITKAQRNNINLKISNAEDAIVYYVRNKCLGGNVQSGIKQKPWQGKLNYDYMLWIDSDIVFSFENFQKLLAWNENIVSGIYMMKGGQQFATVIDWNEEFFKLNGYFEFLTQKDIKNKTNLIEVAYTGFGFMLVKRGVFESLEYPWFRPNWIKMSEEVQDFSSEDVSWCQNIKKNGYKIFIDPTVRVGHEKRVVL